MWRIFLFNYEYCGKWRIFFAKLFSDSSSRFSFRPLSIPFNDSSSLVKHPHTSDLHWIFWIHKIAIQVKNGGGGRNAVLYCIGASHGRRSGGGEIPLSDWLLQKKYQYRPFSSTFFFGFSHISLQWFHQLLVSDTPRYESESFLKLRVVFSSHLSITITFSWTSSDSQWIENAV